MYTPQIFPPHLQYVATLSCEVEKSKNVSDFYSFRNKVLTCSCGAFQQLI